MARILNEGMGGEVLNRMQSKNMIHNVRPASQISAMYADGTAVAKMNVGGFVYNFIQLSVESIGGEIVGKTFQHGGRHYIKTDSLADYIESATLEIDGTPVRHYTMADFVKLNKYYGHDTTDGAVYMTFGGPNMFKDTRMEDAFMLGTSNINQLEILFKLTSAWADNSMRIRITPEFAPVKRPVGFLRTHKLHRFQISGAGELTITSLPINAGIAGILVSADGIKSAELKIDDITCFKGSLFELNAANALYGRNTSALGEHLFFDFQRSQEAQKAVRALTRADQAKRNATISLTLDTDGTGEAANVLLIQTGMYNPK